jgi:hypothetical protein
MEFAVMVAARAESAVFLSTYLILATHVVKNPEFEHLLTDEEHQMWAKFESAFIHKIGGYDCQPLQELFASLQGEIV